MNIANKIVPNIADISRYRAYLMGFAILWVVFYHSIYSHSPVFLLPFNFAKQYGYTGVDIFIFVSGFGLSYSMLKDGNVTHFYEKRFWRIMPTYCLFVALAVILNTHDGFFTFLWKCTTLGYWTNGVFYDWYTPALLSLYLIFPAIFIVLKRGMTWVLLPVFVLFVSLSIEEVYNTHLDWKHFALLYRVPAFLFGSIIGYFHTSQTATKLYTAISLCLLSVALGVMFFPFHTWTHWIVTSFGIYVLIPFILLPAHIPVVNNIIGSLGKASYEIFLFHGIVTANEHYREIANSTEHQCLFVLVCAVASIVVGFVLHLLIDFVTKRVKSISRS